MAFEPLSLVFKFVSHDLSTKREDFKDNNLCKLMQAYSEKRKLTEEEQKWEDTYFSELWHSETYRHGIYKLMGWAFNFAPLFKKYLVKLKYEGWVEMSAPNKTFIRRHATTPSRILRIVELDPAEI